MRSPILLPIRMNAAETSASSAIADWTPLAVVSRSLITAEIETFINDVSTTRTNIAPASNNISRWLEGSVVSTPSARPVLMSPSRLRRPRAAGGPAAEILSRLVVLLGVRGPGDVGGAGRTQEERDVLRMPGQRGDVQVVGARQRPLGPHRAARLRATRAPRELDPHRVTEPEHQ